MPSALYIPGILIGLFLVLCLIAGIFAYMSRRLHPDGYAATAREVREQLQEILDGNNNYAYDDFTSIGPLKNPKLEAIRLRLQNLEVEFPPEDPQCLYGQGGDEVIRTYIKELESEKP